MLARSRSAVAPPAGRRATRRKSPAFAIAQQRFHCFAADIEFPCFQSELGFITQVRPGERLEFPQLLPKSYSIGLTGAGEKPRHRANGLRLSRSQTVCGDRFVAGRTPLLLIDERKNFSA
jgi:hypothetical protein